MFYVFDLEGKITTTVHTAKYFYKCLWRQKSQLDRSKKDEIT